MTEMEIVDMACITRCGAVSWVRAYRDGLIIAIHHKVFTLIAAFSVVCERSITLFSQATGIGLDQIFADYRKLFITYSSPIPNDLSELFPYRGFLTFLPLGVVLFLFGAFLLIGILGLIRDLLIRKGYRVQEVFIRGREYFWKILKFKIPVYVANAVLIAIAVPPLFSNVGCDRKYLLWVTVAFIFFFVLFVAERIILSLGPKIIVVEEVCRMMDIYRRVIETVRPALFQTSIFYLLMLGLMAIGVLVPWGIACSGLPSFFAIVLSVFFLAFVTVVMKSSSFSMYLQLVSLASEKAENLIDKNEAMIVENSPTGVMIQG